MSINSLRNLNRAKAALVREQAQHEEPHITDEQAELDVLAFRKMFRAPPKTTPTENPPGAGGEEPEYEKPKEMKEKSGVHSEQRQQQ